jgi:hypothetical protein
VTGQPLADLVDEQGHRVVALVTPSGALTILTLNITSGLRDGHPCLNRDQAVELRNALTEYIGRQP